MMKEVFGIPVPAVPKETAILQMRQAAKHPSLRNSPETAETMKRAADALERAPGKDLPSAVQHIHVAARQAELRVDSLVDTVGPRIGWEVNSPTGEITSQADLDQAMHPVHANRGAQTRFEEAFDRQEEQARTAKEVDDAVRFLSKLAEGFHVAGQPPVKKGAPGRSKKA